MHNTTNDATVKTSLGVCSEYLEQSCEENNTNVTKVSLHLQGLGFAHKGSRPSTKIMLSQSFAIPIVSKVLYDSGATHPTSQ